MHHLRYRSPKHPGSMQEPLLAPSTSPKTIPRSAPATPDSNYQIHETSRKTHKHNRFKTLFFTPTIRDSGVSLSAAIDDPRRLRPGTPISIPSPASPCYDDHLPQKELDFLVTELATQFQEPDAHSNYPASDRADSPTLGSDSSISLPRPRPNTSSKNRRSTTSSGRSSPLPGASQPNSPLQHSFNHSPNRKPRPKSLALPPPKLLLPPLFQSLALTDANVSGQPIRYLTPNYQAGSNTLRIGTCTFLNLAYGATVECGLRVGAHVQGQKVILQIVQRVVGVDTDHTSWLLCSETDVSSAFTPAVRSELANRVDEKHELLKPEVYHPDRGDRGDVWIALAHTLNEPVTPMTTRMPVLPATPPPLSPGLTDLLSLLTELRFMHRHFFIVKERAKGISWMSSSLRSSLAETCMLQAFMRATKTQSQKWFAAASSRRVGMFRERLRLPKVPGFAEREEEMGVVGVWMSEDAGGRTDVVSQGCWICFVVAAGAEEVI